MLLLSSLAVWTISVPAIRGSVLEAWTLQDMGQI